jgi:aminoglycoside 3-N-acetyltransferase
MLNTYDKIKNWLINWFIGNSGIEDKKIKRNLNANYLEDGWIDSLEFIKFVSDIEEYFGITFSNDEFQNREFSTIDGLTNVIKLRTMENKINKYHYAKEDIYRSLRKIGLKVGDCVFVHSNIGFFGILKEAESPEDYYRIFKDVIFEVIGKEGTLIVPTFSYSYCHNEIFVLEDTPGMGGIFAEMVRCDPESTRSIDANFSIAAIGKRAKYFTKYPPENSFGKNCFWERFLGLKGKLVNFNFDAGSTFIHYVEKQLGVPYRYDKVFFGTSVINGQKKSGKFYHFVYDLNKPSNGPDFTKFYKKAKELNLVNIENLGKGQIVSITAEDTFKLIRSELKINSAFLIKGDGVI